MEATQSILLNKGAYGFFPDYDYAMQKSGYYTDWKDFYKSPCPTTHPVFARLSQCFV